MEHQAGYAVLRELRTAADAARLGAPDAVAVAFEQAWQALAYFEGPLELHIAREEGPLFPRLKAAMPAGDRLIDEMVAEHDLIRMKRYELRAAIDELLSGHDEVREDRLALRRLLEAPGRQNGKLTQLQRAVQAIGEKMLVHFQNEEELVFPLALELLDAVTLDLVMDEMAAIG